MVKRTPTETSADTDTPVLHGHYDGPRGHEDEHRHLGGDKAHPHKRDSHLGRAAAVGEYVPGELLAQTRRKLAEQRRVLGLADPDQTAEIDPATTEDLTPSIGEQILGPGAVEVPARSEAQRQEIREDAAIARRDKIAAAVTPAEIKEMERIRAERTDAILPPNGQPRPVAVSGAPGSRLADVAARTVSLSMDGYPADVQDEVAWTEIAIHALASMREEQAKTKRPADPALVAAALDAVDHVARARGLVRGGGS